MRNTRIYRVAALAGTVVLATGCASTGSPTPQARLQLTEEFQARATLGHARVTPAV